MEIFSAFREQISQWIDIPFQQLLITSGTGVTGLGIIVGNCTLIVTHYRDLYNRIEVSFYDKNIPGDPGFTLPLNQRMNYMEVGGKKKKRERE